MNPIFKTFDFLQATYAISVIRNKLDIPNSIKKNELKAYGIDDLLCDT